MSETRQEWQAFFDAHAPSYDQNPFTQNTVVEIDFLLELFPSLHPGSTVLDVGCGTGRHSVELAKRRFHVTGIDISEKMLEQARQKFAPQPGVPLAGGGMSREPAPVFVQADATKFELNQVFDSAICLCEGGFGLLGTSDDPYEHDLAILKSIAKHLRPNAPFLLTCLNGYSVIRQMKDEMTVEGKFDPATMVSAYIDEWDLPEGKRHIQIRERLFIAPEVVRMLEEAGFYCEAVYGGTAGHWAKRPLMLDEVEAMFVCRRHERRTLPPLD